MKFISIILIQKIRTHIDVREKKPVRNSFLIDKTQDKSLFDDTHEKFSVKSFSFTK